MMQITIKRILIATLLMIITGRMALAQQYYWSNLAGQPGGVGCLDGIGTAAQFSNPNSVAVDKSGNVYVADRGNHTIRKVTAGGAVTLFAGSPGISGTLDGAATSARFKNPGGVAVDANGIVYVADTGNYTIRKVTPDGVVTTLAGTPGQYGIADATGSAALFGFPASVAVDSSGNVYVADAINDTIRKVTPLGVVTTFAGAAGEIGTTNGVGSDARFSGPNGIAVDRNDNLYVADTYNHSIRKISPAGVVSTLTGNPNLAGALDGTGTLAMFNFPRGVTIDGNGTVFVADSFNHTIRKVTSAGVVTTLAGTAGGIGAADGIGSAALFNTPSGVAADGIGNVYVADSVNNAIRKVTGDWGVVTTFAGSMSQSGSANGSGSAARFRFPNGVGVDANGNVFVADTNTHTIRKVTPAGVVTTLAGASGTLGGLANGNGTSALFNNPYAVAVTSGSNLYVADTFNNIIRNVTFNGTNWVTTTIGGLVVSGAGYGSSAGGLAGRVDGVGNVAQFSNPSGVAVDSSGILYISDTYNHTIRQMSLSGTTWSVTTLTGSSGLSGTANGIGNAARFSSPFGVAVDSGSNVYIADYANHTVRKMTLSGTSWTVTTLAGSPGLSGTSDGAGSAARFNNPAGLAVDSGSNVYVADSGNNTIRKITPGGTVITIGGTPGIASGANGVGIAGTFYSPCGVAVDGVGNVYVADSGNNRISVGSCVGSGSVGLISGTGATLSGAASPNGVNSDVHYEYGTSATYGSVTPAQNIGNGTDFVSVSAAIGGLSGNTTYHYRLVIVNASGTHYGTDQIFTTPPVLIPSITSAPTVTGTNGIAFPSYQIVANNSPTSFGVSGLPPGLGLNPMTGVIAGTPTVSGTFSVIISATNVIGTGSKTLTMSLVNMALPSITSAVTASGVVGTNMTYTITATPYVTGYSATGLPPGMKVNPSTGVISGAPTTSGVFSVIIGASNLSGTSTKTLTLTVSRIFQWTSFAGTVGLSGTGSVNGTGTAAKFNNPYGVATDAGGNVYVADTSNNTIRKVTPNGQVTTLAGSPGLSGTANGTGTAARFNTPYGIAVDSGSNVYVADKYNFAIRKITPLGAVTTLAGSAGQYGSTDATGSAARFGYPCGIAVDTGNNIYVADSSNNTIRKITPQGVVTTLAGSAGLSGTTNGTGSAARFYNPTGVTVDSGGNVYVADNYNQLIRKITSTGVVTTLAGVAGSSGNADGTGPVARFYYPSCIAIDSGGTLYVAEQTNSTVRSLTISGTSCTVMTIGGSPMTTGTADGVGSSARFYSPFGIAVSSSGAVFVADTYNNRISMGTQQSKPTLTSALSVSGTVGIPFSYAVTATNEPSGYSALGLPSGLSINAATGAISGVPGVSGSFSLTISATNGVGSDTRPLGVIIWNTVTAWKNLKFTSPELSDPAISNDTASPAGDGISNLMKYALGLDPKNHVASGMPTMGVTSSGGDEYLSLSYAPAPLTSDVTLTVEVSSDLKSWNSGPGFTSRVDTGSSSTVTVQDTTPMSSVPRRFIRLKITKP